MSKPHGIHHLTFLVKELDTAVERYRQALGFEQVTWEELPKRGVRTARFSLGETWLMLVEPTREDSVPGKHLREHGEGVLLVSLGVEDLDEAVSNLTAAGARVSDTERRGAEGWRIQDLEPEDFFGVPLQLTEAKDEHG